MSKLPPEDAIPPPLQMSDRVDHRKFGLGTVSSPPQWDRFEVLFDNPAYGSKRVVRAFLTLVSSPDAKGGPYWEHEFTKVLEPVLNDRSRTDGILRSAFRDTSDDRWDAAKVRAALERERAGIATLLTFLDADEAGEHH